MVLRSQCLVSLTTGRHNCLVKSPTSLWSSLSVTAVSTAVDIEWLLVSAVGRRLPQSLAAVSLAQRRNDDFGVVFPTSRSGGDVVTRRLNRLRLAKRDAAFSSDGGDGPSCPRGARQRRRLEDVGISLVTIGSRTSLCRELSSSTYMTSLSDARYWSEHKKSTSVSCSLSNFSVASSTEWCVVGPETLYITQITQYNTS